MLLLVAQSSTQPHRGLVCSRVLRVSVLAHDRVARRGEAAYDQCGSATRAGVALDHVVGGARGAPGVDQAGVEGRVALCAEPLVDEQSRDPGPEAAAR